MSQKYDNTDKGALFKNDRKENDKHPDMKGTLNVGGKDFWISAWFNQNEKVGKFVKLAVTEKEEKKAQPEATPAAAIDTDPF
jgi:hypothetical protein